MADITKAEYLTVIDTFTDAIWKTGTGSGQGFVNATEEVLMKFGDKFTGGHFMELILDYAQDVRYFKLSVPVIKVLRKFVEDAQDWP